MTWVLSLIPGMGIITKVVGAAIEILTPIVVAIVQLFIWWLKKCWEGIVDMSDNFGSVTLLLSVSLFSAVGGAHFLSEPTRTVVKTVSKCQWWPW